MFNKNYYLIKAIYDWCLDNSLTPYIAAYIKNNHTIPDILKSTENILVFNISITAAKDLLLTKQELTFTTRFNEKIYDVIFPINTIITIFAKETADGITLSVDENNIDQENLQPSHHNKRNFKIVK